ncbi:MULTISPECIES: cell envelope integrity protein CreD [unclassified Arcicella]|uniref:cell envelope integrity protein CreD n=1 Tax=unclassified Arcicella TaxID=2644986 RepID=UPI00285FB42C|nr:MULTISPECIES: cell envelope integrity protein CreD [unclassified Arcicella]MDR6563449.1 inner membrane protein [Arcicella sp. BE51]MDR6813439.1 inner membrane protein [Arcicella sp. BE140]MDR6824752.1 inner membrane protein [Arcicella sp. BE139]
METPEKLSLFERFNNWVKSSVMLKLFSIFILILLLMIPSTMLESLIHERQITRDIAEEEITSKWGSNQTIGGAVITIPYTIIQEDDNGKKSTVIAYAHFLPEHLNITGKLIPEKRYRGIYVVMLYNAQLHLQGFFKKPNVELLKIPKERFLFSEAFISFGITDMKGIKEAIKLKINGIDTEMNSGIESKDLFASGASCPINLAAETINFDAQINLNGSKEIDFLPFGKTTKVTIESSWGTPSFVGESLPDERQITEKGFKAVWNELHLNRNYPQQGVGNFIGFDANYQESNPHNHTTVDYSDGVATKVTGELQSSFGVKLLLPVDEYQKTMRSTKYNLMFIVITFIAFFFVEILNRKRLHPIQYLLVGFAICLFYVLLLAISEHLSFNIAYLIGCITILTLITFYTQSIFKNSRITLIFNGILSLLYGFFYSLLQLEDYSLLLGSIGLLIILTVVMYLTRNIDWYRAYNNKE